MENAATAEICRPRVKRRAHMTNGKTGTGIFGETGVQQQAMELCGDRQLQTAAQLHQS
jgi:hypothetical protein